MKQAKKKNSIKKEKDVYEREKEGLRNRSERDDVMKREIEREGGEWRARESDRESE